MTSPSTQERYHRTVGGKDVKFCLHSVEPQKWFLNDATMHVPHFLILVGKLNHVTKTRDTY